MPEASSTQTSTSDEESTTSVMTATCTRTRTVKTPKYYDGQNYTSGLAECDVILLADYFNTVNVDEVEFLICIC